MRARIKDSDIARERYAELKHILEERRREILSEVQEKMRDVRAVGAAGDGQGVLDAAETSEADIQDDIEFALIQMKSETLHKIEEALTRHAEGTYGYCFEPRRRALSSGNGCGRKVGRAYRCTHGAHGSRRTG